MNDTILIVEDSETQAEALQYCLEQAGFEVVRLRRGDEALEYVEDQQPAVVVSDVLMPAMDGFELCRRIKSLPDCRDTPVLLLTALSDPEDIIRGLESGADSFMVKPWNERMLVSRVRFLTANSEIRRASGRTDMKLNVYFAGKQYKLTAEKMQILDLLLSTYEDTLQQKGELARTNADLVDALATIERLGRMIVDDSCPDGTCRDTPPAETVKVVIVEDSATQAVALQALLRGKGCRAVIARNGEEGLKAIREHRPDIVLSDIKMPKMDGYQMCAAVKQDKALKDIPVVLLTSLSDPEDIIRGLQAGADFYLTKPYDHDYLLYRLRDALARGRACPTAGDEPVDTQVAFGGRRHMIQATRQQIMDLLLCTYENAVRQNRELRRMRQQLEALNTELEQRVHERTLKLRRAETQLRHQQKLESIGTLAGGVAHEINNPINGVMNYAQLIKDGLTSGDYDGATLTEFAGEIIHETERVATIVRDLLTFARQDKQQSYSPGRAIDIVKATMSLIRTVIKHDQIALEIDVAEDLPDIRCRSQQIQQVLMNLMTNARDALNQRYPGYHENKVMRVAAQLVSRGSGQCVRITVEDHGAGIPPDARERIFDPFFTTKPRDAGTGLGLAISHGIIREHRGELHLETVPGKYTRFHLDLPLTGECEPGTDDEAPADAKRFKRRRLEPVTRSAAGQPAVGEPGATTTRATAPSAAADQVSVAETCPLG